jgi:hypothetical protein
MLIGLADNWWQEDAPPFYGPDINPATGEESASTITIGPMTIKTTAPKAPAAKTPATQPRTGITKVLDKVAPRTLAPNGTVRVWGMPPAVAYLLMALAVGGVGLVSYRALAGGGRRVTNPRRRRRGSARGRGSRGKR